MIGRAGYDLLRAALRLALRLWPLWLFAGAWWGMHALWEAHLLTYGATQANLPPGYALAYRAWPAVTLAGPVALMLAAVGLHRAGLATRTAAIAGIIGVVLGTLLTAQPEWARLSPWLGRTGLLQLLGAADPGVLSAVLFGFLAFAVGVRWLAMPGGKGPASARPLLRRAASDNHGHADWLSMEDARRLFPGPAEGYGGIAVGEAYRVDGDSVAGVPFDPEDRRTWGRGGTAPLLVDPCLNGPTHALGFAGSGGFKTTSITVPTLITWTGSAVVLDPSCEVAPMMTRHRQRALKHRVVTLDPRAAGGPAIDVLDWIDTAHPLAAGHVEAVAAWIVGEPQPGTAAAATGSSSEFFRDSGQGLVACILADMLWDPHLPREGRTLRELRRRVATPEEEMRGLLRGIHGTSRSPTAKELAGTLKDLVKEVR